MADSYGSQTSRMTATRLQRVSAAPLRAGASRYLFVLALLGLAAVRLCWLQAYPLNSDEAQHAHVAWAWTRGLLPYRDVFDNHGPLFGLIHSLVLRLTGERADVMTWLRLSVQPWYALALAAVWCIGRRMYGARVAMAALLITGLFPRFFLISGQFRTDDLWAAAWLAALALVVGAPWRYWRWLLAGVLAGAALAVSQKTLLLLATTLLAALIVWSVRPSQRPQGLAGYLLCGLGGLLLVPLGFLAWFQLHGTLDSAWYGLAGYNMADAGAADAAQLAGPKGGGIFFKLPWLLLLLGGGIAASVVWLRQSRDAVTGWAVLLALQAGFFLLLIWFVWPLITRQDFLPVIPPLVLVGCGIVVRQPWLPLGPRRLFALAAVVVLLELGLLVWTAPPWHDELAGQRAQLADVLRYTDADDTVMDAKGDAIFRMRPYYPVLESLAMRRMRNGLMADTITAEMVRHRTMLIIPERLPRTSESFLWHNYMQGEHAVWIAAQRVPANGATVAVHDEVPGRYVLVDGTRPVSASLDGGPSGSRWDIARGDHSLSTSASGMLYLVWDQAWDRGWRPSPPAPATESH